MYLLNDFKRKLGSKNKLKKYTTNTKPIYAKDNLSAAKKIRDREIKAGRLHKGIFEK